MPLLRTLAVVAGCLWSGALAMQGMTSAHGQTPSQGPAIARVTTGADGLVASDFAPLIGKRVGLVTNHTGRVGNARLIDVLARAPNVRLVSILTPEHGLGGSVEAGSRVENSRDAATGIRVHSLYGRAKRPTPAMLAGLDVLVFDIQDIGVRYYTYISTMGLVMQAAAAARLPLIVLDRPNPLGGEDVAGFVREPRRRSFVGLVAIPQVHGLTVGELARMIKGERLLPGLDGLSLEVVALRGWRRDMRWPDIGLDWVPTSPNIPNFETALVYAGTGLIEGTTASEGRGTTEPFLRIGYPGIDGDALAAGLGKAGLPGVRFQAEALTPKAIPGMASRPKFEGRKIAGIRLFVTDAASFRPVETGLHVLVALDAQVRTMTKTGIVSEGGMFDRLAGTSRLARQLATGASAPAIIESWRAEATTFKARRAKYVMY